MATESFFATALPYSAAPDERFHVSLFITHRLTPDGAEGRLRDFEAVRDWTRRVARATITLRGANALGQVVDIPVRLLDEQLDAELWPRVFPRDLPVRPFDVPDLTAAPWRTFPAHRMQQHALLAHAVSIFSSPVAAPTVAGNALTVPLLASLGMHTRGLDLASVIDGAHDPAITRGLDARIARDPLGGMRESPRDQPLLQLVEDVHRARRFYQRAEDASAYRDRPLDGATARPVRKPAPDFHERAGMLGDLSPLLRRLGLILDLRVEDPAMLAPLTWIQARVEVDGLANTVGNQPRTSCRTVGRTFSAVSPSGDYDLGMLRLGDEGRFTLLDLDPDASALKLEQLVRNMPRLYASERNGDPTTSAPATLRGTGFALARIDRAARLHQRMQGMASLDGALRAGTAAPLALEQVSRGIRLEVWDNVSGKWHSLHQRLLSVAVEGAGEVLDEVPDTGFLQGAALAGSDAVADGPRYAHEVLAGWDGWSLAVPRPGKTVVHEDGEETLHDEPPVDPSPVNPVVSRSDIAPGTLPRLRYGRQYAFRAYTVDLAGNSRPHLVGDAPTGSGIGPVAERPTPTPAGRPTVVARPVGRNPTRRIDTQARGRAELDAPVLLDLDAAAAHTEPRIAALRRDATSSATDAGRPAVGELLRASLHAVRPRRTADAELGATAAGIDPQGFVATGVAAVDRIIGARLGDRLRQTAEEPTRVGRIDRVFGDAADQSTHLLERTDVTDARVAGSALASLLAQQPGLGAAVAAGGGLDISDLLVVATDLLTTPRPFLRWDPIVEPAVVPRHAYTEGESLLRLVIRSGVEQDVAGELPITITPPADYAAETVADHPALALEWREDSQRHLAPPKTSQFDAELHGAFDTAFGPARTEAQVRAAYGIALRESGSFLDATVADIANPGERVPQPGMTFHVTPTSAVPDHANPGDLPDGDALSPGQYVAHDVDELVVPYLPDPLADGVALVFPDAGKFHRLSPLLAMEGITLRYPGGWPERVPLRLVLESGPALGAVMDGHVVRVTVPPGEQLRMRMSSSLRRDALDLLGLWRSLPQAMRDLPVLQEAARDGWFWWLTPAASVRLVHAVPRPVEVPRPTVLLPLRAPGDTSVAIVGALDLHGPSTERIDMEAAWSQWVDDVTKPGPERVSGTAAAFGTTVDYDEDLIVLAPSEQQVPLPDGSTLRLHEAVHQTGDTQHRMIAYTPRATTRYREYFSPQVTPDVESLSVVGPSRTIDVPSSARPAKLIVRDVLPLFRWDEQTEPAQPFGVRRMRRSGVRIYLERPWYVTGDGELVGVIVAPGSDALLHGTVSQWGADPVWWQQGPAVRSSLPLVDLLHFTGLDDRREAGRPVGPVASHPLIDWKDQPRAWVLGYQPEFSPSRGLWFVDVAMDPGTAFWPFVQLAIARYQPSSLPGLHLGPVTMCDFVQLAPERAATLSRTDDTHARVQVTGAVGYPLGAAPPRLTGVGSVAAAVAASRTMRARLERHDAAVGTDLGWVTVAQHDLPILGADGTIVSWSGEIELPEAVAPRTPGTSAAWRITLEEWEYLPADDGAGGKGGREPRIVYADHLPL